MLSKCTEIIISYWHRKKNVLVSHDNTNWNIGCKVVVSWVFWRFWQPDSLLLWSGLTETSSISINFKSRYISCEVHCWPISPLFACPISPLFMWSTLLFQYHHYSLVQYHHYSPVQYHLYSCEVHCLFNITTIRLVAFHKIKGNSQALYCSRFDRLSSFGWILLHKKHETLSSEKCSTLYRLS